MNCCSFPSNQLELEGGAVLPVGHEMRIYYSQINRIGINVALCRSRYLIGKVDGRKALFLV